MGHLQATEFANRTDLDTGLRWHLQSNHFPAIPLDFLWVAKGAIKLGIKALEALEFGESERSGNILKKKMKMPNGKRLNIREILEGMHLWAWVERTPEEEIG